MNIRLRTCILAGLLGAVQLVPAAGPVLAQSSKCDPNLRGLKSVTGYRDRGYACEGMYIGTQTTPLNIQVVSFVRGTLDQVGKDDVVLVGVDIDSSKYEPEVRISGTGRRDNLNWAIHGAALLTRPMRWPKKEVIDRENLSSTDIGVYGVATPKQALGDVVFVPVVVFNARTQKAAGGEALELVLRVPAANAIRWQLISEGDGMHYVEPDAVNPGFFKLAVPAAINGAREAQIAVWWRRIGTTNKWSAPELLTIYR